MVWSLSARWSRRHPAWLQSAKTLFRDARPWLVIIAAFAAVALAIDFCFVCLFQALR